MQEPWRARIKSNVSQHSSFVPLSDDIIAERTASLGIVLGNNASEIVKTVYNLKELEERRLSEVVCLQNSLDTNTDNISVCSQDESIDLETLNLLWSEISECLGDGGCDPLVLQTPLIAQRRQEE